MLHLTVDVVVHMYVVESLVEGNLLIFCHIVCHGWILARQANVCVLYLAIGIQTYKNMCQCLCRPGGHYS